LGYRITGPYENVARFRGRDVRRHFQRCYGARNMVLCVSGAVEHAPVVAAVERAMSALPEGRALTVEPPNGAQTAPRFAYVENEGSQTSIQILFRGLCEKEPDYPSLLALARVI